MAFQKTEIMEETKLCDDKLTGCQRIVWCLSCCNSHCYYVSYGDVICEADFYWCGIGDSGFKVCCCVPCGLPFGLWGAIIRACCLNQSESYCCCCTLNKPQ